MVTKLALRISVLGRWWSLFYRCLISLVAIIVANDLKIVSNSAISLFLFTQLGELVSSVIRRAFKRDNLMYPDSALAFKAI